MFTAHYIEEAERLCERLVFIVQGKIVREGTVEELMKETQGKNIIKFSLGEDFSKIKEEFRKLPGEQWRAGDPLVFR